MKLQLRRSVLEKTQKKLKVVYVIGPFRANCDYDRVMNIREAEAMSYKLWELGFAAISPHMNTANMEGLVPDEIILAGDIAILDKCDFAITTRVFDDLKIKNSSGSMDEIKHCKDTGIPVYESIDVMKLYEKANV